MAIAKSNPLFTRSEKRRGRVARAARKRHSSLKHRLRGYARSKFGDLLGIPLNRNLLTGKGSRHTAHRSQTSSPGVSQRGSSVRGDVISGLTNQGYSKRTAESMVPAERAGESFDSLFRRSGQKNPGELIIFGNPAKVYGRKQILKAKRAGNPIPLALLEGFKFGAGEVAAESLTSGKRSAHRKKKNPAGLDRAEKLFETFHHRGSSGVYETQRSAKARKNFTILGPLVAIGINAEKYEEKKRAMTKSQWEEYKVEQWDKLPHLAFLTGSQIAQVKRILEEPDKYVKDCPQLASSPNGKQLYAITPDGVEIDLRQFDTDASKDFVDLGDATFVVYIAKKPDNPVEWVHELGEDGGARPRLVLNRLGKKELFFVGGTYTVEGPGILN